MDSSNDLLQQLRIDRNEPARRGVAGWSSIVVIVVVIAAAAAWWHLRTGSALVVEVATAVAPSTAASGPSAVLQATGYVTARRQATVSAQITGTLTRVMIEEGEHVDAGQIIALLDDTAQKAALTQAQAAVRAAKANLVQLQATLAQNRRDLKRADDLVGRKLVSAQSAEIARTQVDTQIAQVESQRKQVDVAEAGVRAAQVQLDYCTVRAPFAGVVIAKAAQVGEIVSPFSAGGGFTRTGIGTIVDMDSLEIEVDVNESYIHRVSGGQRTEAVLDAYPDWKIAGHVIAIIPTADRSKATVKVRVGFDRKDPRIVPDMGVRVSFLDAGDQAAPAQAAAPSGVLVPADSIVERGGKPVVFAVEADTARKRSVTPGQTLGELRLVDGIGAGTRVVRKPAPELGDAALIEIRDAAK